MAVQFDKGVVIGADSRTTTGSYIVRIVSCTFSMAIVANIYISQANRVTDKLTHVHDRIYCCRSGSAADTQAVADIVHYYLQLYTYVIIITSPNLLVLRIARQTHGSSPPVSVAAGVFQDICYENKDGLSAGIIVAGWDKETGPSVYNIPLGGGLFRQPWAIGGMLCMFHFPHRVTSSCLQALVRRMCTVTVMPHTRMGGDRMKPSIS
jgi:20S proteasome subunit beta 1